MNARRKVGGYTWQDELDRMKAIGEELTGDLVKLGRNARSVETANHITRMVALAAQIPVKAMELKEYRP